MIASHEIRVGINGCVGQQEREVQECIGPGKGETRTSQSKSKGNHGAARDSSQIEEGQF